MKEIIHVQVGRCGNIIGKKFWDTILNEHQLDSCGRYVGNCPAFHLQRINVYFKQLEIDFQPRYVPRAILVNLDPIPIEKTITQCFRQLIENENIIFGCNSAGNNWAKGYYTEGPKVLDAIMDIMRKEAELCDSLQGIQVVHGLGGGTGGGLGSLLSHNMLEQYPDKILKFYSVIPSRISMSIPDVYNTVLTLQYLNDNIHQIFCIDYDTIDRIHKENQEKKNEYDWMSSCMSGITTCLRFPCQLNTDLRKLQVNMVPHPRLHFFVPGYAETKLRKSPAAVLALTQSMFDNKNILINCNLAKECFFTIAAIFRGKISPKDVSEQMLRIQKKYQFNFVNWIPNNTKIAICDVGPCCSRMSVTSIFNTSAIRQPFQQLLDCFQRKANQKWYLHWYINEGMNKCEFVEAQDNLQELLDYYGNQCCEK